MNRRGRVVIRCIATALLLGGGACVTFGLRADAQARSLPTTGDPVRAATPLLSPRRLPALFDDIVATHNLQASVDFAFAGNNACISIEGQGRTLASHAAEQPLAPASTQKLLTGAAALAVFGADHRFVTRAVTAAPIRNGVVQGDVYVVGNGDPVLATPAFITALHDEVLTRAVPVTPITSLATAIAHAGVHEVDGAIVGDDSAHDRLRFLPAWKPVYRTEGDIGALSALAIDHGYATPGSSVVPDDPASATAARVRADLTASGVTVDDDSARSGTAPAGAREIARITSPPLGAIVAGMLTASDNWIAELLARDVGAAVAHSGTTAAGTAAITRTLASLGVNTAGVSLVDGSGLAPSDRVTCTALLGAVDLGRQARFRALDRGLAIAGVSGTLATRFVGDPLQGVLRAKTGHIDGVAALAGVVDDRDHLRFAFIVNGQVGTDQGMALQATAARLVAAYPQLPTKRLVPPPGP